MASPRKSAKPRRNARARPQYATRDELEQILTIIERNTVRIGRLEDVFAMEAKERAEVKEELEVIRNLLLRKP